MQFWTRVYTEVSTGQGYIHDAVNLAVVYQTLSFPPGLSPAQQNREIEESKKQYQAALSRLGAGKREGLSALEASVLRAWPPGTNSRTLQQAANNVRFQRGQADRFRDGLVRSGQWKPHIRSILARHDLPLELDVLPHVESSFNPGAYSKVAAAGMWQFMPATAQRYMLVNSIVDQRMDPYVSTEAAARLLQQNYQATGSWPLAITAYNIGAGGMLRATRAMATTDIEAIIRDYRGPGFGFASRNFYTSFLAALEVDRNASRYFGKLQPAAPLTYDTVVTSHYVPATELARAARVDIELLRRYNPSLLEPVWTGEKHIPRGFQLRIPRDLRPVSLSTALAAIPAGARFNQQQPDVLHRIASGESLSTIARRYNTSIATLMSLNGLRDAHRIRAGQNLRLPGTRAAASAGAAGVASLAARSPGSGAGRSAQVYVIQKGDSLWQIARRFNVSHQELASWNDLTHSHRIKPGQVLRLASLD
ncbi:MAG: LysM peptidoglycan-binding domain-containing protein [Haliea sp.]|uniref:lytic transglycosylase domain-containing protein n=1 Tax=Haliea sp. TaxID=1932666 RepID=UPI0032EEA658